MVPGIEQRHVVSSDGTRIGYQVRGNGPCVVLANGLGGTYVAFKHLYDALGNYKTICWDYRGLYSSSAPKDPRANTMAHHIDDLMAILAAEQVDQFVLVGWSMGVQVGFETIKRHRARVRGLCAINGTYGKTFKTVMGSRFVSATIPMLLKLIRAQASLVGRATKVVAGSDALISAMKRVGLVSQHIDIEIFRQVAAGFQHVDWVIYSDLLQRLDEHDAEDVLATIDIPVSIITGDRDLMTPPATAEHIHRLVPGSRLVVIKGGSHYTPVEYPAILVDELGRFLDRIPGVGAPMSPQCPQCGADILDIDIKCGGCGAALAATGAHKMIGQVMLGQYELVDVLGQGGMSVVFKGKHKLTDQEVALKILPPELAAHSQVKSRFLEEAKALAALDHGNIVHLYNFGQENGFFVLAMQFVAGQTWERMILEAKRLDWRTSCKITCDVLRALEYAHGRGVIHRDMKPSNVLVRKEDGAATVMDFGIAKMTTSTRLTATGQTMGTVRYMSPEQVRGQEVDLKTDLYSLGATLYESLTGETPFDGNTHFEIMTKHLADPPKRPSSLGVEVPASVEDALMRSLAKKADDRFVNAREMRKILELALRDADPGLVDTQRVSGEALSDLRAEHKRQRKEAVTTPEPKAPTSRRVATASDLADELEGATGPMRTRPARSIWPWIALGALILAGGAVAALLILRDRGEPKPIDPFAELKLAPAATIGSLVVVTDGTVPAKQVAEAYRSERARVLTNVNTGLANRGKQPAKIVEKPYELYAVPQAALCIKNAYIGDEWMPKDCNSAPYAYTSGWRNSTKVDRLLLVSSDLAKAVKAAVADTVCLSGEESGERSVLICDLASGAQPVELPTKDADPKAPGKPEPKPVPKIAPKGRK